MSDARRVLVIADDGSLVHVARLVLEGEGYTVLVTAEPVDGLRRLREALPSLVIIDVRGDESEGFATVAAVREITAVPLLVLLASGESAAIVRTLDLGADDCAAWPLPPAELLARTRALLRRAEAPPLPPRTTLTIDEHLTIDFSRASVVRDGRRVELRPTEYRLLYHLASNPGRVLTYESLLARIWGSEYREEIHYVRLYAGYLRQKIEPDPAHPRYILTERGLGYRFVDYRGR